MSKSVFLFLCLFLFGGKTIKAENLPVDVTVEICDDTPIMPGKEKAPLRMPRIYQDGYKLTLSSSHPEYIINIVQDDEIVYTSVIPAGVTEFELPSYLNGECIIQFISGRFCFHGQIKL